jgi:hypothetical protein
MTVADLKGQKFTVDRHNVADVVAANFTIEVELEMGR